MLEIRLGSAAEPIPYTRATSSGRTRMANQQTSSVEDANVSRRELRVLKWLTALLVPGTIILIYELVRQEALEHLLPALPSQFGNLVVWGLVLLITYLFSTFVFRVVDRLQGQALARGRDVATMRAVLEERARLSRELHDGFAQLVAFLLVRIDTVTDLVSTNRKVEALGELERMRSSTDDLYQDVREAITELRIELAQRGLAATLRDTPRSTKSGTGSPSPCTAKMPPGRCRQWPRISCSESCRRAWRTCASMPAPTMPGSSSTRAPIDNCTW